MIVRKTEGWVWLTDFQDPLTEDQYDQVVMNDEVARALVRRANTIDLETVAEKVRS